MKVTAIVSVFTGTVVKVVIATASTTTTREILVSISPPSVARATTPIDTTGSHRAPADLPVCWPANLARCGRHCSLTLTSFAGNAGAFSRAIRIGPGTSAELSLSGFLVSVTRTASG